MEPSAARASQASAVSQSQRWNASRRSTIVSPCRTAGAASRSRTYSHPASRISTPSRCARRARRARKKWGLPKRPRPAP